MILIQAATSDKAPVLRAALSSPQCNNLLSAYSKMELIAVCQFNATVILIMLFQSSPSQILTMSLIFSVLHNCSAVHHRGSTPKCRLNQNKCNNFALSSGLSLPQMAIYTCIMDELLHQIKSRASCNEL